MWMTIDQYSFGHWSVKHLFFFQDFAQDVFCSLDHVEFDGQSAWGLGCGPDVDDQQKVQMAP